MIKQDRYTANGGMDVDSPPSVISKDKYVMLRNGRISASYQDNLWSIPVNRRVHCQSGNKFLLSIDSIDSVQYSNGDMIVSYTISGVSHEKVYSGKYNVDIVAMNDYLPTSSVEIIASIENGSSSYILTRGLDSTMESVDAVWRLDDNDGVIDISLEFIGRFEWSAAENFDVVINNETDSIVKMYIADGVHQILSFKIGSDDDIDKPAGVLYSVPKCTMSEPKLETQVNSGAYTACAVQYCYSLFNVNGGQTRISPVSDLIYVGKQSGGGKPDEIVGRSNIVSISNLDTNFDYVRVYAIKYEQLSVTPSVGIVGEYLIDGSTSIRITDNGIYQSNTTIEEIEFLGGTEFIPRTIVSKKNRLIIANITEDVFDVNSGVDVSDQFYFDSRAYSSNGTNVVISDKYGNSYELDKTNSEYTISGSPVGAKHDCVQNKLTYMYHPFQSGIPGGDGRHISYILSKKNTSDIENIEQVRSMKAGEVYRWAVKFYNNKYQESTPQWIADIRVPEDWSGLDDNTRVTIDFTIKDSGIEILSSQGIIGARFMRVERLDSDKTIVAQGIATPMIFQETSDAARDNNNESNGNAYKNNNIKVSCPWVRHRIDQIDIPASQFPSSATVRNDVKIFAMNTNGCISPHSTYGSSPYTERAWPWTEIYRDRDGSPESGSWLHISYQDNRIIQIFSPETIFGEPTLSSGMTVRGVMSLQNDSRRATGKFLYVDTNDVKTTETSLARANLFNPNTLLKTSEGSYINYSGYIGPNKPYHTDGGRKTEQLIHQYRSYIPSQIVAKKTNGTPNDLAILGAPEYSKLDSSVKTYNNNSNYRYTNSLQTIIADGRSEFIAGNDNNDWDMPLYGVDSISANNITFVYSDELPYESKFTSYFSNAGKTLGSSDHVMLMEIVKPYDTHSQSQYGGRFYEDRSLNRYIASGPYVILPSSGSQSTQIVNCGDTFVGYFQFARIARVDNPTFSESRIQMTEIVRFPVETSVNVYNRNDMSSGPWNASFLPTNSEYHQYNDVYSQDGNAITSSPDPYLFKKNTEFANRILASKPKIAGEIIDSWTDILPNEELYLEGEFGPINRLLKYNENTYAFQDNAVCVLSILPRVQIDPSDSIGIELGVGQVLNNYQYINTNSGCQNFDGVISTSSAVYYCDSIRRSINIINGLEVSGLSDLKGASKYVKKFTLPYFTCGFDPIADDVYFNIKSESSNETLGYDEGYGVFSGVYDIGAANMFSVNGRFISIPDAASNSLWGHFDSDEYMTYYGVRYPMQLTICLNPEGGTQDCIFNNLEWTHDVVASNGSTLSIDGDITDAWFSNDYMTSAPINIGKDLIKRFRMSRMNIPRWSGDNISRMRGNYLYATLEYNPSQRDRLIILNDITLYYNGQRS